MNKIATSPISPNDFSLELTALEVKHAATSTALCGEEHSQKSLR